MARILVVDDSEADRRLVAEYLQDAPDLELDYASNGAEALERMQAATPDLVVTDLLMPEVDGLQLVGAVKEHHPLVPVVLMTGRGDETIATEALHRGAASYVPKRELAHDLLPTVQRVLAVSGRERRQARLRGCIARSEYAFVLENDCSLFAPLVGYLQEGLAQMELFDEAERTRVGVALEEALSNALIHGNLALDPSLRETDEEAYCQQYGERVRTPPYRDRRIHVEARFSRQKAVFVVRDEGEGFDPSRLPDPTDPANLERVSGRGILLMRTFMDEVAYNNVGNAVTLTKYGEPPPAPGPDLRPPAPRT